MSKLSKALIAAGQLIDDLGIEPDMIDKIKIDADKPEIVIRLHGIDADKVEKQATQVYLPALYDDIVLYKPMGNFKSLMTIADGPVVVEAVTDTY